MNTTEIYNLLVAGRTLQIPFDSRDAAETFRTRIHRVKASQELHLLSLGMMTDEEVPTFSFLRAKEGIWELRFVAQRARRQYDVVIVNDGPTQA